MYKSKPVTKSNVAHMLQKLKAASIQLGLPTHKLSPNQLTQVMTRLRNLPPAEQKKGVKALLTLMRYEKQPDLKHPQKATYQAPMLKLLKDYRQALPLTDEKSVQLKKNIDANVMRATSLNSAKVFKPNLYELLNVSPTANPKEIRDAGDKLIKSANEKKRQEIEQATKVLLDPQMREDYDQSLIAHLDEVDNLDDEEEMLSEVLTLNQAVSHELSPDEKLKKEKEFRELLALVCSLFSSSPAPEPKTKANKQETGIIAWFFGLIATLAAIAKSGIDAFIGLCVLSNVSNTPTFGPESIDGAIGLINLIAR